ncbi:hypothetical protein AJ79_03382 [Helicocarpus griseus UAMH5409]|uniref:Serine hydrolase domain-containing protein n=1 Tax=Helicocarpus griseus UAMH5409 TaxID=1447875 RepID=A0A2B7XPV6_9EURO|nr:hypothetical protein AJ79_03382 [Helicocarpus griseus UAMH5409]
MSAAAVDRHPRTPRPSLSLSPSSLQSLSLPRIICLHGGGTNARIFHAQCRAIREHLAPYFRLVFAEAPYLASSVGGPDVKLVYPESEWGCYRSWLPAGFPLLSASTVVVVGSEVVDHIDEYLAAAMSEDDALGGTGKWVGLLGFSQGAKMAGSLLLRSQTIRHQEPKSADISSISTTPPARTIPWKFAVLIAGRAPLIDLLLPLHPNHKDQDAYPIADSNNVQNPPVREFLQLPTVHVHGLGDPSLSMHRDLLYWYRDKSTTRLVEWDGDHRVPIKSTDVSAVVTEILQVAREVGISLLAKFSH